IVLFALYAWQRQTSPSSVTPIDAALIPTAVSTQTSVAAPTAVPTRASRDGAAAPPTKTPNAKAPTAEPTTQPAQAAVQGDTSRNSSSLYKDGTFTGDPADANWGSVEVKVIISNGTIANVQFLEYPNHRSRSRSINEQAIPLLSQEAIQAQNANVDLV